MKYLCIHGHFYQPPRENAWREVIEIQDSAHPFHDWNSRICAECYGPNALARVLNGHKDLVDLVNNYSRISFNFGPTLLSWMEEHEPQVYQAILRADKLSQKRFGGHGSAMAQVYNHIILPLANARDRETQIKWGIADFEKRFERRPEAIWLAETACNTETLEALAREGMKFVILAPAQCARVRKIGASQWEEVGEKVDPKRAYLCRLPSGNKIVLFFYDGPVSQGIAFSDTLSSGEKFAQRLLGTYNLSDEPQLMHIATDGETYGHHQKFAEMALAYCLHEIEKMPDVELTVYGEFLEKNPPRYEAQIRENSSWSCCHGVERWRADCGCNSGGHADWNQKWRAPLRKALDFIRDEMLKTYEQIGPQYFKDIWAARNDYINLILDRSLDAQHRFFLQYATEQAWTHRPEALALLEMQRNALLMYTSCGWFFDEISGIETTQIMQYAMRAMELNRRICGHDLEPDFLTLLKQAPSNIKRFENGKDVYLQCVKPQAAGLDKIALEFAVLQTADATANPKQIYCYDVLSYAPDLSVSPDGRKFCCGRVSLKSRVTLEEGTFSFVLWRDKNAQIFGATFPQEKAELLAQLKELFAAQRYENCERLLRANFPDIRNLSDLFGDVRKRVTAHIIRRIETDTQKQFSALFEREYSVIRDLQLSGSHIPTSFLHIAEEVLCTDLVTELRAAEVDAVRIEEILEDAKILGVNIAQESVRQAATEKLNFLAFSFARNPLDKTAAQKLVEFLHYTEIFALQPNPVKAQEFAFFGLKTLGEQAQKQDILRALARKLKIAV